MTRLAPLGADDLEAADRELLARPIELYRVLAHSPRALRAYAGLAQWSREESTVDPRLRELAIICVGACNRSPYVFSHHVRIGAEHGVTEADVDAVVAFVAGGDAGLPPAERAVLTTTRELSASGGLDERTWRQLEDALGMPTSLDLVLIAGYYNMVTRVVAALDVGVEDDYAPYLARYPG